MAAATSWSQIVKRVLNQDELFRGCGLYNGEAAACWGHDGSFRLSRAEVISLKQLASLECEDSIGRSTSVGEVAMEVVGAGSAEKRDANGPRLLVLQSTRSSRGAVMSMTHNGNLVVGLFSYGPSGPELAAAAPGDDEPGSGPAAVIAKPTDASWEEVMQCAVEAASRFVGFLREKGV